MDIRTVSEFVDIDFNKGVHCFEDSEQKVHLVKVKGSFLVGNGYRDEIDFLDELEDLDVDYERYIVDNEKGLRKLVDDFKEAGYTHIFGE